MDQLESFDPSQVPTLEQLVDQLNSFPSTNGDPGTNSNTPKNRGNILRNAHLVYFLQTGELTCKLEATSLGPYVETFKTFVQACVKEALSTTATNTTVVDMEY